MTDLQRLPIKKPGDSLAAEHINALTMAVRNLGGQGGSFVSTRRGPPFNGSTSIAPFEQYIVRVDYENSPGNYNVQLRYYDHTAGEWKDNPDANQWELDATSLDVTYEVNDLVTVWWHTQRMAFVPVAIAKTLLKAGKAKGIISDGSTSGEVDVWENGAATGDTITDVHHDWITGDEDIADGTEVFIGWFAGESCWRVIGAECP